MKLSQIFQATAITSLLNSSCAPTNTVPDTQILEPEHEHCLDIYYEARLKILEIMDERKLNYRELMHDYNIYEMNLLNLRELHPQAFESADICAVITGPIYYQVYRVLVENPNGIQ